MTRRNPLYIRIGRIRVPHLPPGGESALRREIQHELHRLLAEEPAAPAPVSQSRITIPCKSARDMNNFRFLAAQIAESIRQSGKHR